MLLAWGPTRSLLVMPWPSLKHVDLTVQTIPFGAVFFGSVLILGLSFLEKKETTWNTTILEGSNLKKDTTFSGLSSDPPPKVELLVS